MNATPWSHFLSVASSSSLSSINWRTNVRSGVQINRSFHQRQNCAASKSRVHVMRLWFQRPGGQRDHGFTIRRRDEKICDHLKRDPRGRWRSSLCSSAAKVASGCFWADAGTSSDFAFIWVDPRGCSVLAAAVQVVAGTHGNTRARTDTQPALLSESRSMTSPRGRGRGSSQWQSWKKHGRR